MANGECPANFTEPDRLVIFCRGDRFVILSDHKPIAPASSTTPVHVQHFLILLESLSIFQYFFHKDCSIYRGTELVRHKTDCKVDAVFFNSSGSHRFQINSYWPQDELSLLVLCVMPRMGPLRFHCLAGWHFKSVQYSRDTFPELYHLVQPHLPYPWSNFKTDLRL